jgi:glycerol-3-phosphate acyltransferase PlsX
MNASSEHMGLALDAHGGDFGPTVTIPAALDILKHRPSLEILLCGVPESLEPVLAVYRSKHKYGDCIKRLIVVEAGHALATDAGPVEALRRGEDSSLWLAMEKVADGTAMACVSAGSTAAMLALGVKLVGMLPGIERPALMTRIPAVKGHTSLLDLGANLEVSADQLVQFAVMGSVASFPQDADAGARVALLNVGHEDGKGGGVLKEAHSALTALPLNYTGFIEGHDIFAGKTDVAVCDGFTGNLILKSGEGLVRMFFRYIEQVLRNGPLTRIGALLVRPALRKSLARFEPYKHNGAPLLGLRGVVVKSHGHANREALGHAILEAVAEAERKVPELIASAINKYSIEAGE